MNQDDIIRMAREVGAEVFPHAIVFSANDMARFAALVAAAERVRMCEQFGLSKELAHASAKGNEAD